MTAESRPETSRDPRRQRGWLQPAHGTRRGRHVGCGHTHPILAGKAGLHLQRLVYANFSFYNKGLRRSDVAVAASAAALGTI